MTGFYSRTTTNVAALSYLVSLDPLRRSPTLSPPVEMLRWTEFRTVDGWVDQSGFHFGVVRDKGVLVSRCLNLHIT